MSFVFFVRKVGIAALYIDLSTFLLTIWLFLLTCAYWEARIFQFKIITITTLPLPLSYHISLYTSIYTHTYMYLNLLHRAFVSLHIHLVTSKNKDH